MKAFFQECYIKKVCLDKRIPTHQNEQRVFVDWDFVIQKFRKKVPINHHSDFLTDFFESKVRNHINEQKNDPERSLVYLSKPKYSFSNVFVLRTVSN